MSQSLPNLRILHTKFGLIWTAAWTDKKDLFLIFLIEKIANFRTKNIFFLGKLHKKLFLLHTSIIQVILHTKIGSLWTTRPDKISLFLEIEKSENVDISDWNTNFFLWKLGGPLFLSQNLPTLRILHNRFGLLWTTSWLDKKGLFLKFLFREIQKVPYEILIFFLSRLYQKFFLIYILTTLVILDAEFDLIWTTPWPDEKDLF